jgi:hypothetical protein
MLLIAIVFVYYYINPSEVDFLPKCVLYTTTGFYCPGCGSQRATHHLLNFNILGVLQQNLFYFVVLLIVGYHLIISSINLFFKKHFYNYLYHPKTPVIFLIFLILFWILRNIPFYPFNQLAPK